MDDKTLVDEIVKTTYAARRDGAIDAVYTHPETGMRVRSIRFQDYPTVSPQLNSSGDLTLLGFNMVVDRDLPDDVIEFRDESGKVVGRITDVR